MFQFKSVKINNTSPSSLWERAVMEAIEMEAMRDMKLNGILDEDSSDDEDSEDELKIDEDYIDDDEDETNDENVNRNHQKSVCPGRCSANLVGFQWIQEIP
ncbi:hypothetical protein M8J77_005482 [Diaphorina citri]|nr:hypothetical protein M8J77_005482 [Diaphorina citri]